MLQFRPDRNSFYEFTSSRNRPTAMHAPFRGFPVAALICFIHWLASGLLFALVILERPVMATELEVDNLRGSDLQANTGGQRLQAPYRTLQRAIDHAIVGDTIKLRVTGEPYRECVSINTRNDFGARDFPLIIDGNGATLDGTKPLGVLDWRAVGGDLFELKFRSPGYVKILAASDQPTPENLGHLTELSTLEPFQYARNSGSVYFKTRRGDVPRDYGLRVSAEQTGLTLYDVSDIVIRNLNVVGYRLDGINCHDLVVNVRFENVVSADNGRSGISVGGASRVVLANSRLAGNGDSQARAEGQSLLELSNVNIDADVSKAIDRVGGRVIESR